MEGATSGHERSEQAVSEEELRQAYEQQIKQIQVQQLLLENVVTILNLGMRRTGLAPGTEDERDAGQVRLAVESVRALLPLLEQSVPEHLRPIRDALSQLQMAFVKIGGQAPAGEQSAPPPAGSEGPESAAPPPQPKPGEPGPAQRSGRLWVPGQ